jgi:hypothetical protein
MHPLRERGKRLQRLRSTRVERSLMSGKQPEPDAPGLAELKRLINNSDNKSIDNRLFLLALTECDHAKQL